MCLCVCVCTNVNLDSLYTHYRSMRPVTGPRTRLNPRVQPFGIEPWRRPASWVDPKYKWGGEMVVLWTVINGIIMGFYIVVTKL